MYSLHWATTVSLRPGSTGKIFHSSQRIYHGYVSKEGQHPNIPTSQHPNISFLRKNRSIWGSWVIFCHLLRPLDPKTENTLGQLRILFFQEGVGHPKCPFPDGSWKKAPDSRGSYFSGKWLKPGNLYNRPHHWIKSTLAMLQECILLIRKVNATEMILWLLCFFLLAHRFRFGISRDLGIGLWHSSPRCDRSLEP